MRAVDMEYVENGHESENRNVACFVLFEFEFWCDTNSNDGLSNEWCFVFVFDRLMNRKREEIIRFLHVSVRFYFCVQIDKRGKYRTNIVNFSIYLLIF